MYKKFLVPALVNSLIFSFFAFAKDPPAENIPLNTNPDKGIVFIEASWNKALQFSKEQKKLIFLDAFTTWCGPCKQLKKTTFVDKEVGNFFNDNFINIAIDMERGEGPALAKKYGIYAYPSLLIADADGKIVTRTLGFMKPEQLLEFGKQGLSLKK